MSPELIALIVISGYIISLTIVVILFYKTRKKETEDFNEYVVNLIKAQKIYKSYSDCENKKGEK